MQGDRSCSWVVEVSARCAYLARCARAPLLLELAPHHHRPLCGRSTRLVRILRRPLAPPGFERQFDVRHQQHCVIRLRNFGAMRASYGAARATTTRRLVAASSARHITTRRTTTFACIMRSPVCIHVCVHGSRVPGTKETTTTTATLKGDHQSTSAISANRST